MAVNALKITIYNPYWRQTQIKKGFKRLYALKPLCLLVVPKAGLEPARVSPLPPQDSVSTKFHHFGTIHGLLCFIRLTRSCVSR